MYDESLVRQEYGVIPQNLVFYRVLTGDASDNIKGVKGVGDKTIESKMSFLNNGELELDEFINECSNVDEKLSKKLMDNIDVIRMNFDLMQLRDPEIASSIKSNVRAIMDNGTNHLDPIEFKKMFMGDKLYTAFADVDSWLRNSFLNLDNLIKKHLDNQK
jgi:DNA polymerase-1